MMPSEVVVIDKLPLLGSGKIDNVSVTKLVREMAAAKPAPAVVA
jgi:acyl-[acyl-carrier-protein]-phospholipid O-acyltransferase/long-chain-fatty-acid--[acyl-carrier-protein] ligase